MFTIHLLIFTLTLKYYALFTNNQSLKGDCNTRIDSLRSCFAADRAVMNLRYILAVCLFLLSHVSGYWDTGTTTVAYIRTDVYPRQSFFRWQMVQSERLRFYFGSWDWTEIRRRRRLNCVAGISIGKSGDHFTFYFFYEIFYLKYTFLKKHGLVSFAFSLFSCSAPPVSD